MGEDGYATRVGEAVPSIPLGVCPLVLFRERAKEVKQLTGESFVPVLVLDGGEVIRDSENIVAWARDHPAGGTSQAGSAS